MQERGRVPGQNPVHAVKLFRARNCARPQGCKHDQDRRGPHLQLLPTHGGGTPVPRAGLTGRHRARTSEALGAVPYQFIQEEEPLNSDSEPCFSAPNCPLEPLPPLTSSRGSGWEMGRQMQPQPGEAMP